MLKYLFLLLDAATKCCIPRETQIANGQRETGVICPNRAFHLPSQVRLCRRAAFTVDLHFYQRWPFTPSAAPPPSAAVAEISGCAEWRRRGRRVFPFECRSSFTQWIRSPGREACWVRCGQSFIFAEANDTMLIRLLANASHLRS